LLIEKSNVVASSSAIGKHPLNELPKKNTWILPRRSGDKSIFLQQRAQPKKQ
jgi:hypothetical protein